MSAKAITTITIDRSLSYELKKPGEYRFEIIKPQVELTVAGAFELTGSQSAQVSVTLVHQVPHTRANTTLKGVVRDKASLTFIGRIIINENCGDTQSFLTERILLLSNTAHAKAIPDLEILSDDVSCSHAASVSYLPSDQIFYLMSRGLSRQKAEKTLIEGFLSSP